MKKVITGALLILLASAQAAEQPDICKQDEQTQQNAETQIKKECALAADPSNCEKQAKAYYQALVGIHCSRTPKERQ
ncbi:hypothetical protein SAMN02745130_01048 [Thiothrix eikelboomii]|uniref:Cysteine rich repeat-containing protein n=1 Tax=Thiothrix eikelboomii TaxID=92487 RepID=A0A1T4W555_9GAMM|nr:hypothetical protein [Thiothrix eikelboomii]SKA72363.1 hypothetical protein SAMN02745130_01048 [Thiothrix eikelboomii]